MRSMSDSLLLTYHLRMVQKQEVSKRRSIFSVFVFFIPANYNVVAT